MVVYIDGKTRELDSVEIIEGLAYVLGTTSAAFFAETDAKYCHPAIDAMSEESGDLFTVASIFASSILTNIYIASPEVIDLLAEKFKNEITLYFNLKAGAKITFDESEVETQREKSEENKNYTENLSVLNFLRQNGPPKCEA